MNLPKAIQDALAWQDVELPEKRVISVPNAKEVISQCLSSVLGRRGEQAKWITPYDEIAEWLCDSKGKGLLLTGNCGNGKTVMARYILPPIIQAMNRRVFYHYNACEIQNSGEVMTHPYVVIDDIGVEDVVNNYGSKSLPFAEIVDNAEKKGYILIVTTNLTSEQIGSKYGSRILDRLTAICRVIKFNEHSFRQ